MPEFRTAEERQRYFKANATSITTTHRVNGAAQTKEHVTLKEARAAGRVRAREAGKAILIYGVIGQSSEWQETFSPSKQGLADDSATEVHDP